MMYLYHLVPENMQGNTLYPLNLLKGKYSDAHEKELRKYDNDREDLPKRIIPILNCLWSDVLFFAVIHPIELKKALVEAGIKRKMSFYQVNPKAINPDNTVVYLCPPTSLSAWLD